MYCGYKKTDQKGEVKQMKYDVVLAGVGGQGVVSLSQIIATGAMKDKLKVRQAEVHGMAQRGGAVISHLRISDLEIAGDLVPKGAVHLILATEPLESLRHVDYLSPDGMILTSTEPFINIPNYPDKEVLLEKVRKFKNHKLIDAVALAKQAGAPMATNMVMVGAATKFLPISKGALIAAIELLFAAAGKETIEKNIKAFELGIQAM